MESKIFVRNRVLGGVSNAVPVKIRRILRRKENFLVTCFGKSFYTWNSNSSKLRLKSVSPEHDAEIHCLEADKFLTFTASGNIVQAWRRGVELKHTYRSSSQTPVHLLLPFGPHLIGVDESNVLSVWDIASEDLYLELNFDISFQISATCHPPTYIDKILIGSKQGKLQLWNLKVSKLKYTFERPDWKSPITVLTPSSAIDIVGIGMQSGQIVLLDIRFNNIRHTFIQDWGPVTRLSFCTDDKNIMASGSDKGHIVFWHLEEERVISQLLAHDEAVCGLEYLPHEQLIISSSSDNSLKMWRFDVAEGSAHCTGIREGHKSPPSMIRFHGVLGSYILSGDCDGYLRAFNTVTEIDNKNLGRALKHSTKRMLKRSLHADDEQLASKVLPIVDFTAETTREKEWDDIAALHPDKGYVSTWSFDKCKFGQFVGRRKQKLSNTIDKKITATSVFVTHCGNFVVVGYSSGTVDKFNIQSGTYRDTIGQRKAHKHSVTGLFVNNVNLYVVSGGDDGFVKFWSFQVSRKSKPAFASLQFGQPVTFFRSHNESSLVAVALLNYNVVIVDADCCSVIRKFVAHCGQLTDLCFSPDCRWLVSASMDSTLKTWDIPSGKCVDSITLDKPCVSVTFSPTALCIATAHVDTLGITLWNNRCLFSLVSLDPVKAKKGRLKVSVDVSLANALITFSNDNKLAIAHSWQNILNVDTIRERNRLKEPPKVPAEAPFVLPVIPALNTKFDLSEATEDTTHDRFLSPAKLASSTLFAKMLANAENEDDFAKVVEKLKSMSLLAITFEISSLAPDNGGSVMHLCKFILMLKVMFKSRKCFEVASSFLAQFLKAHSSLCMNIPNLFAAIESLSQLHNECWSHLQNKLSYNISISKFFMDS